MGERAVAEPRGGGCGPLFVMGHVLGGFFDVHGVAVVEGSVVVIGVVVGGVSHDEEGGWVDSWRVKDNGESNTMGYHSSQETQVRCE